MRRKCMNMTRLCCLFFLLSIGWASDLYSASDASEINDGRVLRVTAGSDRNYPPYEFTDDSGRLTGFNIELLKAVAAVTQMDVRFVADSWNNVRKALDSGRLDIASGMFYNDDRARQFNFSLPHSMVYYSLFVTKDSFVKKIEDTAGKSIIVIEGDIMHDYALSLGFKKDIVIAAHTLKAVEFLSEGRYEAALLPKVQTLHILSASKIRNIKPAGPLMLPQEYCFAVQKDLTQVHARLDEGLKILKTSGEYQALKKKWFGILPNERYAVYLKVTAAGLIACILMLLLTWIWNRTLAKKVKLHTRDLNSELAAHRLTLSDLEKKEEQLRGVLESSFDAILALDRNRRVSRCNPAFARQFGYSMEEMTGCTTLKIHVDEAGYEKFQSRVYPEVEQTGAWRGEWRYRTKIGKILEYETTISIKRLPNGTHDGYVAVMRDVTKRKNDELERVRLVTAIEQSADAIIVTDVSGRILFMNAAAEKGGTGNRGRMIGTRLVFPGSSPDVHTDFDLIIDRLSAGGVWHGKFSSRDDHGRQLDEEIAVSRVLDDTGAIINYVVVKRDITQVSILEKKLHQSRKLEAVGTLAGGIAHDFGNILASLIGYAEMALEDDLEENSPARHDVEQILKGSYRARELVDEILTFSRRSKGPVEPLHLIPLIEEAAEFIKPSLPESVVLDCRFDCTDDLVFETPAKLYQLMVNLITNSSQALKEKGGRINVKVSNMAGNGTRPSDPAPLAGNDTLCIRVTDDGPGMSPEVQERIFDPYFTTKDQSGGSGLGLSVVHGIVTGLGGSIDVKSAPGSGTCFLIRLPLNQAREEDTGTDSPCRVTGHTTILLVDDEQETVAVMRHSLIRLGYEVVAASNMESALNILRRDPDHFHLLIIDMALSSPDGLEIAYKSAETAKRICPELPVVLCRGYAVSGPAEPHHTDVFDDILQRPLSSRQIAGAVARTILKEEASRPMPKDG